MGIISLFSENDKKTMEKFEIEDYTFTIDKIKTKQFYSKSNSFCCECSYYLNFYTKISIIKKTIDNANLKFEIDFHKDVGQRGDELHTLNFDDYDLYIVPYYVYGEYSLKKRTNNNRIQISEDITISIEDISYQKWFNINSKAFTVRLEYKTNKIESCN